MFTHTVGSVYPFIHYGVRHCQESVSVAIYIEGGAVVTEVLQEVWPFKRGIEMGPVVGMRFI